MSNSRKTFSIMVFCLYHLKNVVCDCGLGENVILLINTSSWSSYHSFLYIYPHHRFYIQYKIQIFPLYLAVVVRWYIVVDIVKVHLHIRSKYEYRLICKYIAKYFLTVMCLAYHTLNGCGSNGSWFAIFFFKQTPLSNDGI